MIFFAAGDPEGNCHETCQQLGDGNRKPDAVRAEPQRKRYNGDDLKNNGLEERDYWRDETVVQRREERRAVHAETVQEEREGKESEPPDGEHG
mgnify:CR=1 FL=1